MPTDVSFGDCRNLPLTKAILLYETSGGADRITYATLHEIDAVDGRPVLAPGVPIARDQAVATFCALVGNADDLALLPPTVLAASPLATCWYRPPGPAALWFDEKLETLAPLSGKPFHHPGLIFIAGLNSLIVRAFVGKGRPAASTRLYRAPYFNVSESGNVCLGTADHPLTVGIDTMAGWERCFFDSRFSHTNNRSPITKARGGLVTHWRGNRATKRHSKHRDDWLVDAKETLGALIANLRPRR
jgi:PRTRC genetic system protein B